MTLAFTFPPADPLPPGRHRKCRVCGDWHALALPWPHNCRPEAPPRSPLASPQLAPKFQEHMTGVTETAVYIGDRSTQREYMKREGLVTFDAGVSNAETWTDERRYDQQLVQDIKRSMELDPLAIEPVPVLGREDLNGAPEVDMTDMPVIE